MITEPGEYLITSDGGNWRFVSACYAYWPRLVSSTPDVLVLVDSGAIRPASLTYMKSCIKLERYWMNGDSAENPRFLTGPRRDC